MKKNELKNTFQSFEWKWQVAKYRLKKHVSPQMLAKIGFEIENFMNIMLHAKRKVVRKGFENHIYVMFVLTDEFPFFTKKDKEIIWEYECDKSVTPYIQDMIKLGYVETVKKRRTRNERKL